MVPADPYWDCGKFLNDEWERAEMRGEKGR
jgi:hypothetical protein